ncbi:hypothetical protein TrRE_jg1135 [Triparma retinervis]|uniref:DNA-directed RNA polymerase subunit n=1 Tax=Triparma retinervis TaxID=2557542 RepID=A0A9W6ZNY5_9STRA|nr:hypothetical protein TrRE_jg1135 [Triparma retinervis]
MWFCPYCGSLLQVENDGLSSFICSTCPYRMSIKSKQKERIKLRSKKVDDVLGGKGAWDNVDKTNATCPKIECSNGEAFFMQIQIRSADEPMSTFYKCAKCGEQWCHR